MNTLPLEHRRKIHDLVAACLKHNVEFYGTPGVFMVRLTDLHRVLPEIAHDYLVLGFDSFTLDGAAIHPRLDFYTDFGEEISADDALAAISSWPQDEDLWVETVLVQKVRWTKAEVRGFHSPDIANLQTYRPKSEDFGFLLQVFIGPLKYGNEIQ